jgi:parallel beta-helix repeat protein
MTCKKLPLITLSARRDFLRRATQAALPIMAMACFPYRSAAIAAGVASPTGAPVVDVRDKGARGDGKTDDTSAIQSAIDALPTKGGIVHVPAGTYLVDATRSIRLRNGTHLVMDAEACLQAMPNDRDRHYVLLVEDVADVEISGGRIVGERDRHEGSTGEWGYGIFVRGARRVTVKDIRISRCWGDGICIGAIMRGPGSPKLATDVTLSHVVCTGNRRQGLSIGPSRNIKVLDSEFSDTKGVKPGCGIDIEPEKREPAQYIEIARCKLIGNQGSGIQVYENVAHVTLSDCLIEKNTGYGALVVGAAQCVLTRNVVSGNGMAGASLGGGANDVRIVENTFSNNTTKHWKQVLRNVRHISSMGSTHGNTDIQVMEDTHAIVVTNNTFAS